MVGKLVYDLECSITTTLAEALDMRQNSRVFDAGCGRGGSAIMRTLAGGRHLALLVLVAAHGVQR